MNWFSVFMQGIVKGRVGQIPSNPKKSWGGGNDAAGQIQGLTASGCLPQLPQDAFLLGGRNAETWKRGGSEADQAKCSVNSGLFFSPDVRC